MVASNLNTGNETRITRRIIAEDNDWTLQTVPYLRTMALETIIQNWEEHPHLDELSEKERRKVLSKLRHRFKFIFVAKILTDYSCRLGGVNGSFRGGWIEILFPRTASRSHILSLGSKIHL